MYGFLSGQILVSIERKFILIEHFTLILCLQCYIDKDFAEKDLELLGIFGLYVLTKNCPNIIIQNKHIEKAQFWGAIMDMRNTTLFFVINMF